MFTSSNRFRYHYEYIVRQDLLLKLNYPNIMQVPRLCEINISSRVSFDDVKSVSLALEILCGQKFIERISPTENTRHTLYAIPRRSSRQAPAFQKGSSKLGYKSSSKLQSTNFRWLETSLRAPHSMYNFLEKFITALAFYDYTITIHGNTIQITIGTQVRLFPEIQNHFEFFENAHNLQVRIITSALSEKETQLLWTGFLQKEN
jgi:ribosomal protein L5